MSLVVLVCGGRNYFDKNRVDKILSAIHNRYIIDRLVQGGQNGADYLAKKWALKNNIDQVEYKADWEKHGRAAGPRRNKQMLQTEDPDLIIAFPGGKGTDNMISISRAANKKILIIKERRV